LAVLVSGASVLACAATAASASAASFTVKSTADEALATASSTTCETAAHTCTLRAAVQAADNAKGTNTIELPAGEYKLTIKDTSAISEAQKEEPALGDLDVLREDTLTIKGAGSGSTIINANHIDRAFAVHEGAGLTLSGMTIENGEPATTSSGAQSGGAIYSDGALTVTGEVRFQGDAALNKMLGGAIYSGSGTGSSLAVSGATFLRNSAEFDDNVSNHAGDAIAWDKGALSSSGSSFVQNVGEEGGGLYLDSGKALSLVNATISENIAGYGGGLDYAISTPTSLTNETIAYNSALHPGGGLYDAAKAMATEGATGVRNTISAENGGGDCGHGSESSTFAAAVDVGYDLGSDETCFTNTAGHDKVGVNPLRGTPEANGGPVLTNAPEPGSPAIDAGNNEYCPATDARGIARSLGGACDIVTNREGASASASATTDVTPAVSGAAASATTGEAKSIGDRTATLNGSLAGVSGTTAYFFQYGTTNAYGLASAVQSTSASGNVSSAISGLEAKRTYHYRIVAVNGGGISYGADRTFNTAAPPKLGIRLKHAAARKLRYKVAGKLFPPAGFGAAKECSGTVVVMAKRGKKVLARRRVKLTRSCSYQALLKIRRARLRGRGKLTLSARFLGNSVFSPAVSGTIKARFR
jgi:hypothetical protein